MAAFDSSIYSKDNGGASYLVSDDAYHQYVENNPQLGRADGENGNLFCAPSSEIDQAIENSGGDIHKLESELGLDEGSLGDGPIHRVDIQDPEAHNLRAATGEESGANCYFNTPRDEDGNLPDIQFVTEDDGMGNSWTARDSEGREIIDADKTDPDEIAKLNGRYATNHGDVHDADTSGYDYTTSGGIHEGVVDQVPNDPECVSHSTISGWERDKPGTLSTESNPDAYAEGAHTRDSSESNSDSGGKDSMPVSENSPPASSEKSGESSGMPTTASSDKGELNSSGSSAEMPETSRGGDEHDTSGESSGMSSKAANKDENHAPETSSEMPAAAADKDGRNTSNASSEMPAAAADKDAHSSSGSSPEMPATSAASGGNQEKQEPPSGPSNEKGMEI